MFYAAHQRRFIFGVIDSPAEVFVNPQFEARGYFVDLEHPEMGRVKFPGAPFLMDYLHAAWVIDRLDPESVDEINGTPVRQTRWVEGDQVFKRIEIGGVAGREPEVYHERVRLYSPEALRTLLREQGLEPTNAFGGYDGAPFQSDSARLLLLGRTL